jgi:hypothetical protein
MSDNKVIRDLLSSLAKRFPVAWGRIAKKRYVLPQYRQADYYDQDFLNLQSIDYFTTRYKLGDRCNPNDVVNQTGFALMCKALEHDRPTFYLERELGELLARTEIPDDFSADDIHWRWPQMRILLPKGLLSVVREGHPRNMMFVDIGYTQGREEIWPPQDCTDEMARIFNRTASVQFNDSSFCLMTFASLDGGITYGGCQPIEKLKLSAIRSLWNTEATPLPIDQEDEVLIARLDQIILNILLYLSHLPVEYQSTEIRKPKRDGKRMIPGLYAARFIGDLQVRSKPIPRDSTEPTGRHLPGHWRSGHWRRQAHGVGRSQRRLVWIMPYKTLGSA